MNTKEVSKIFEVSVETVKSWRKSSTLCPNSPLRLVGRRGGRGGYTYDLRDVEAFAMRNDKYKLLYLRHFLKGHLT